MEIPFEIKIGGLRVTVIEAPLMASERGHAGEFSFMRQEIRIDPSLPEGKKKETLVHEIVEAINAYCELDLPHDKITVMAFALHQVLTDNKIRF